MSLNEQDQLKNLIIHLWISFQSPDELLVYLEKSFRPVTTGKLRLVWAQV